MATMDSNATLQLVNWDLAASSAAKLAPPGPKLSAGEVRDAVANLRELADLSVEHVHRITGLETKAEQLKAANAALGGAVTGAQMGAILAFLSSKVLGQYDPFVASSRGPGGPLAR